MHKSKSRTTVKQSVASVLAGWFKVVLFLVALTGVFLYTRVGQPTRVEAAANSTINFQARLMTAAGGIVPDGTYNVEFKLYNASSSSGSSQGSCSGDANCLWTETRTSGNKVTVRSGYLTVNLGSVTSFPSTINWDQQLWLTMNIGGTGAASWDGEMSPRLTLTAVPFALRAGSLATYNGTTGFTSTLSILQPTGGNQTFQIPDQGAAGTYSLLTTNAANAGYIQNQSAADQTADFRISGTGRANTSFTSPVVDALSGGTLSLGTSNATAITIGKTGVTTTNSGALTVAQLLTGQAGATISGGNFSFTTTGASNATFTSDLSIGARSASALTVTQASNVTNDNSASLVQFTNNDGGSTAPVLTVTQGSGNAAAVALSISAGSFASGIQISGSSGGYDISASGITTGVVFNAGAQLTTGSAFNFNTTGTGLTSGVVFSTGGTASGALSAFTGNLINIVPDRVLTGTSITDTGRLETLARTNTVNSAGQTFTVQGDVANFSSNCTQTAGTCTDNSNILELQQNYANATGAVLNVGGAGTGNLATLDATNASANGVLIDVQSNSASQYALKVTTNNGANTAFQVNGDGSISEGVAGAVTTFNGSQITNNGATLNTSSAISDKPTGGNIGTAAATVDSKTTFDINQTTAGQTLTLPTPTVTTSGRMVYVNNVGSASFIMYGSVIATGKSNAFIWNGSSWVTTVSLSGSVVNAIGTIDTQSKSSDGAVISTSAIYLQTADASFPGLVSTGTQTLAGAKTFTSLLTGSAGATITGTTLINSSGTANTTIGNVSNANNTVTILAGSTGGINIGTSASAQNVTIGNSTGGTITLGASSGSDLVLNDAQWSITGAGAASFASITVPGAGTSSEKFGSGSAAAGNQSVALGNGASAAGANAIAIGYNASSSQTSSVVIGEAASNAAGSQSVVIGTGASVNSATGNSVAIGNGASITNSFGTAVGSATSIAGSGSVALGYSATAGAGGQANAIALGYGANSVYAGSIAIGRDATATAAGQLVIGSATASASISNGYFGNGVTAAAPQNFTLQGTGSSTAGTAGAAFTLTGGAGTTTGAGSTGGVLTLQGGNAGGSNIAGANLALNGGQGTGTGNGGNVIVQVAKPGSTGSSNNSLATVATFSGTNGSLLLQNSADSTAALDVKSSGGTSVLTVDTTNSQTTFRGINSDGVLGAELVTSQAFNNATYWTTCNGGAGGWTGTATQATHNAGNSTACTSTASNFAVTAGATYQVSFTVSGVTSAISQLYIKIGGGSFAFVNGNGAQTVVVSATNTTGLQFTSDSPWNGTITSVSVKRVTRTNPVVSVANSSGTTALELRVTTDTSNAFIGLGSGRANIDGFSNTALGTSSLYANTSGANNTAVGNSALSLNSLGNNNSALGSGALLDNTTGSDNTAIGLNALTTNNVGSGNTGVGSGALSNNASGSYNSAVGYSALQGNFTGSYNNALGYSAGYRGSQTDFITQSSQSSQTLLGNYAQGYLDNSFILGGQGADQVAGYGFGTGSPTNFFSVTPKSYNTGTVSLSSGAGAVTGVGTTFTSSMVGMEIFIASNSASTAPYKGTISAFTDATHVTVTPNASATYTARNFYILYQGLQVTSAGKVGVGILAPTAQLQVVVPNGGSTDALVVDNAASSGNVAVFKANGTAAVTIGSTGNVTLAQNLAANGNTTIGDATTDRLTVTSQILGGTPLVFQGATDNSFATSFAFTDPTANRTITFGDETGTVCTTAASAACTAVYASAAGNIVQVPTSTAINTITPTAASVVGLTVNATSSTSAVAAIFNQANNTSPADTVQINTTNTSGTQTNGLLIARNGAGGTTTNLLNLTNTAGTATNGLTFTGTFTKLINSTNFNVTNAGAVTAVGVDSGAGLLQGSLGLTVTGAAVSLNDSSNFNVSIAGGTSTGTVNIGTGTGVQTLNFGTGGTGAKTVTVGSTASTSALTLQAGTGGLNITTQGTGSLNIGNNAVAQTLNIGNTTGATALNVRVGTGNYTLDGVGASTYDFGTSTVAGTFALGGTAQTGAMTLGRSTATNTISIGSSAGNGNTQTINIGTSATAGSTTNVVVGSTIAGTTTLQSSGGIYASSNLTFTKESSYTLSVGDSTTSNTAGGALTVKAATGAGTAAGGALTLRAGNADAAGTGVGGSVILAAGSGYNANGGDVTINAGGANGGTTTGGSVFINSGAGLTAGAITLQTANFSGAYGAANINNSGGTVNAGTGTANQSFNIGTGAANKTVTIGSNTGTSAVTLQSGSGNINLSPGLGSVVITGTAPASVAGNGTAAANALTVTGAAGGATSGTTGQTAGAGAAISITGGTGGSAGSGSTNGAGGNITLQGGAAGAGAGTASTVGNVILQGSGGKVGIGTSGTPSQLLAVGGTTGNLTIDTSGNLVTAGTIQYANGTANTNTLVCKNASGQLAACSSGALTGTAFVQGGNSFGALAQLGTTDGNGLQVITNSVGRAFFDTTNNLYLGNANVTGGTNAAPAAFTVQGTGSSTAGTTGALLVIKGGAGATTGTGSSGGGLNLTGGDGGGSGNRNGGAVLVQGGAAVNVANGGSVTIQGGAGSTGGSITIDAGTDLGTHGTIGIGTSNAGAISISRTGQTTTVNGALTVAQLLTGQAGATVSGAAISLNDSSNFNTSINGGTSTGTVTIGNSAAAAITLQSGTSIGLTGVTNINASANNATNIGTGTSNALVSIGGGSGTFALDTTNIDISSAGAISGVTGYTQSSGNFSYTTSGASNATFTSDLSSGARSASALTVTQANNASNDNSASLVSINNQDTGSTVAALTVTQAANGNGILITSGSGGGGVSVAGVTTGTGYAASSLTSGTAFSTGASLTSGIGFNVNTTNTAFTSGSAFNASGSASGSLSAFTGNLVNIAPDRTLTGTSITDTGRSLSIARTNTVNSAGQTFTVSGDVASLSSNCTQTAGTCTDSGNILELQQSYANATGAVLNIGGAGTGNLATLDATNSSANGVLIDIQSSSSSQYGLKVTTNNGANTALQVNGNGSISQGVAGTTDTVNGALTVAQLLTGNLGATISGAAISLNDSSNFGVSIAGGTSTGQVDIGTGTGVQTLNFGTGGTGAKTVTVGSTASTGLTTIQAGTAGVRIQPANGTTALDVRTSGNTSVLTVDTTNSQTNVRGINSDAVIGSELVTSQDFTSANWTTCNGGAGGWSGTITTATHNTGNTFTCSAAAGNFSVTAGATYQVTFTLAGNTTASNTVGVTFGGSGTTSYGANATYTTVYTASTTASLIFSPSTNFNGTISAVSVKQITLSNSALNVLNSSGTTSLEVRASGTTTNSFIGLSAGASNSTGSYDTAFGAGALFSNTTGIRNTAVGYNALKNNTTGNYNVGLGYNALRDNSTGIQNVAIGGSALATNLNGNGNIAIGGADTTQGALNQNKSGNYSIALGISSLGNNTTGSYNVALGYQTGYRGSQSDFQTQATQTNQTLLGAYTQGYLDNSFILGGQGADQVAGYGFGTGQPDNFLSVTPKAYNTGTVSLSSGAAAVTGSGTTFTSSMVGMEIFIASNSATTAPYKGTISAFTDATHVTVSPNASATYSGRNFYILYPGLQVTSTGKAGIGTFSPTAQLQVVVPDAGSTDALVVDNATSTGNIFIAKDNGTAVFTIADGGAVTATQLITGQAGLTVSGAAISLNDSSNFNVSIAGGTSTGTVNIGTGTGVQALNFGTGGTGAKTVTLGSTASTSSLILDAGTGTIGIGTSASTRTVNIATGAAAQTVTLGSNTSSSSLALQAGTGGLQVVTNSVGRAMFDTSNNLYLGNANTSGTAAAPNNFSVLGTSSSAATVAGGALTVQSGAGNTSGAGGALTVAGGTGGATGTGGLVTIQGGAGGATSGAGGALSLVGGAATAGNSNGGAASLTGGAGTGTGNGGALTLTGGAGGTGANIAGGAVSITGGSAALGTFGTGGAVSITGGSGFSTPGAVTIQGGWNGFSNYGALSLQTTGGSTTLGNTTGASAVTINSGTGNIDIGTGAQARTVNVGTGAAAQTVNVGSTNSTSTTTIQSGSGGVILSGATSVSGSNTFTSGTGTVLLQGNTDIAATKSFATKAGTTYTTPGSANDVAISTASFYLLDTSGAAQTLTGIVAGRDGQLLTLVNADVAASVTLSNESSSSAAANRITTGTGSDLTMLSGASVSLIYDATNSRWRVVGISSNPSGYANTSLSNLSSVAVNTSLNPGTDNTLDLGSTANSWRTLYADTSVLTAAVDYIGGGSGTLSIGTTNATTVAVCTTANCDTINIGTGGDADTITVGDSADTVGINGAVTVGNTLAVNGNTTLGDASGDSLTITGTAVSIPNNLNFDSNTLFIDAANNRVGIGTAVPSTVLTVSGAPLDTFLGSIASISGTYTGANSSVNAIGGGITFNPAAASTYNAIGISGVASSSSTSNLSGGGIVGVQGNAVYGGTGTIGSTYGVVGSSSINTAGTISTSYGLYAAANGVSGGGAITNNYGVFVEAQTAGTNDYGVAIQAADTQTLWLSSNANNTTANAGIAFGSSRDTNLYRSAADTLKTDDNLVVGTNLTVSGTGASTVAGTLDTAGHIAVGGSAGIDSCAFLVGCNSSIVAHYAETNTDTALGYSASVMNELNINSATNSASIFAGQASYVRTQNGNTANYTGSIAGGYNGVDILGNGTVTLAVGSTSIVTGDASAVVTTAVGNYIQSPNFAAGATVTNVYGELIKAQNVTGATNIGLAIETAGTQTLVVSSDADNTTAAAGIAFGSSRDTNLYRSAASTLKTDGGLHVGTKLQVGAAADVGTLAQCDTTSGLVTGTCGLENVTQSTETGNITNGQNFVTSITPSAASNTAQNAGTNSYLLLNGSQSFTNNNYSVAGWGVNLTSAGTVNQLAGTLGYSIQAGAGSTVTDLIGVKAGVAQVAGTVTNAYGVNVTSASGTIGTNYGIKVDPQTTGTTDYGVAIGAADTQTLWLSNNADNTTAAAGIAFGSSLDTNLYRSAASTLKTDSNLVVAQDATIASQIAVGSTATITSNIVAEIKETYTTTGAVFVGGSENAIILNAASNSASLAIGNSNTVTTQGTAINYTSVVNDLGQAGSSNTYIHSGTGTVARGTGVYGALNNQSTGTITTGSALTGFLQNASTGTITTANGLNVSIQNASTGTITTANGISVASATNASGTLTNNYGINVAAQTAGTNDYGIAIGAADTQTLWLSSNANNTTAAAGIGFGSSRDTNLYRGGAGILQTDGDFDFLKETAHTIQVVDSTTAATAGGALTVKTGAGSTSGAGGLLTLQGGAGGATGIGGALALTGGAGGATSGAGGAITLTGGAGTAGNSAGGALSFTSGAGQGTAASGNVTLAVGAPGATSGTNGTITIQGTGSMASQATNGIAASTLLSVSGYAGGATSGTTGQTGGIGSAVTINTGTGGAATGASGANIGGAGGAFTIQGGTGGAVASITNAATGGAGSAITIATGVGGAATGASGNTVGGAGGLLTLQASAGGNVTSATGASGQGGAIAITSGAAGTGGSTAKNGGAITLTTGAGNLAGTGGTLTLQGGTGGATGVGGAIAITAGAGGATSGTGGALSLAAGAGSGTGVTSAGGALSIAAGAGSNCASCTAGAGGNLTLQAGNGGSATSSGSWNGGAGGSVTISAGTGGDDTGFGVAAAGGGITLNTGSVTAGSWTSAAAGNFTLTAGNSANGAVAGGGSGGGFTLTAGNGASGTGAFGQTSNGGAAGGFTLTGGNGGSAGGASNNNGANGGGFTFTGGTGGAATGSGTPGVGGGVTLNGGTGSATGAGGAIALQAGAGGATSGNGGALSLQGGTATTSGNGGAITITGGTAGGANTGGAVTIQGGTGTTGGALSLLAGYNGNTSAALNIGTVGSSTKSSTINIANTSDGTSVQTISIGSTANTANAITLSAGATGYVNLNTGQAQFSEVTGTRTLTVQTRSSNVAGSNLTLSAGTAGSGATGVAGGTLTLQGGGAAGTTGAANGGDVTITGGTAINSGYQGLVNLSSTAFSTAPVQTISSSGVQAITAGNQNIYSTLPITASVTGVIASLGDPGQSVIGRILYVTARSGSNDFTLRLNASRTPIDITMKANSTATLIWNGTDWTAAGASSSTDLQAAYNNTVSSAGGAELVLNAPGGNADGLTIRNNATTPITGALLEVQTSVGSNLLSVNNNATEYASNGGSETSGTSACSSTFPANTWSAAPAGGTCSRDTTSGEYTTGQASASLVTGAVQYHGIANKLSTTLTAGLRYTVSFTVKGSANFTSLEAVYSSDGTATAGNVRACFSGTATLTGTAGSQSTTTITGSNFTSAMVGSVIVFANGQSAYITGYTNSTTLTTSAAYSQTVTSQNYSIYTNTITTNQSTWTRVTCDFIAPSGATSSNAVFIRQNDATARTFFVDNLSVTVNASVNHAVDGSVDSALGTNWVAVGGSVTRDTTNIYDTSGAVSVSVSTTANRGVYNNLSAGIVPTASASGVQYRASFYLKANTGTVTLNSSTPSVYYSPDGGTTKKACYDLNTTSIATTAGYTLVSCVFTTDNTTASTPRFYITNTATTDFYVDALTITLNTNTANNVQIGGANKGGPVTLFTLDRSAGAPIAANNDAYLGSMYFDTSTNSIQCYGTSGWGACGAAPDNIVNLNPEYAGAVLNGTGIGTMTADFCGNGGGLSVNTSFCASGEARNYYKWTSPQASQQTYSIYVTYQLPSTFKSFASDNTVQLTGRVDSTSNAAVTYQMFSNSGGSLTACGTETTVTTSINTWQTVGINGNESTGCSFSTSSAGSFIIFKINMKAQSNANAYVSTLSFTTKGQ